MQVCNKHDILFQCYVIFDSGSSLHPRNCPFCDLKEKAENRENEHKIEIENLQDEL